jgi:hypothetical protein
MSKRRTIGDDPLAAYLDGPANPRRKTTATASAPAKRSTPAPARPAGKVRATFHLPAALVDEARNAVVTLAGPPVRLTLARLVEDGIRRELDRLRKAHHDGKPFPARAANLVGGRPIRS